MGYAAKQSCRAARIAARSRAPLSEDEAERYREAWRQPGALTAMVNIIASKALCADAPLTFLPEATHWVAHDEPERVNAILLDFLKSNQLQAVAPKWQ